MELRFVRPNRCDASGPNCVEVAIDADQNRIVRNSQRPEQTVHVRPGRVGGVRRLGPRRPVLTGRAGPASRGIRPRPHARFTAGRRQ